MSEKLELPPSMEAYILHWGEMGPSWGVNRTVAQIHALLWIWNHPIDADVIAATLGVARSNVSMSIKELREWGLIVSKPVLGRRKENFTADKDPWDVLFQVMAERRKREFDPTVEALRHCRELAKLEDGPDSRAGLNRLTELSNLLESLLRLHDAVEAIPRPVLKKLVTSGGALSLLKKSRTK